ncbi:MAG: GntR family transcriptional regulator [Anaerolineae bacterium]|jgi:GntR family transcriptional regulator|nr:GntR family transcriptional regulator [Anaerolineae bacterium]
MLKIQKGQTTIQLEEDYMHLSRSKPISEQVNNVLRERICNTNYAPGERLPSESALSKEFGVSRATIRTVLAKLAVEGLILRRQGDGTYVNERVEEINTHLGGLWDFAHLIERSGFEVSIQSQAVEKVRASEEEARVLAIDIDDELILLKRLFLGNGSPIILAKNLIPASLLAVPIEKIDGNLRIREIMKQYFLQEISFVTVEISSRLAEGNASILNLEQNAHLLNLNMRFYSNKNEPLTIGDNYLNDKILKPRLVQAWH